MTDIYETDPGGNLTTLSTQGDRASINPFTRPSASKRPTLIEKSRQSQAVQGEEYATRINEANEAAQAYNEAIALYAKQNKPGKPLGFLPDIIEHPLEKLASGLYWTYSKFVSQPLAFSLLYARGVEDRILNDKDPMSARDTWNQARHFSPGQAFIIMSVTDEVLKEKGIDLSDVNAGLHDEGLFGSGWARYLSGAIDFGVSWYADPAVLALRGAGKAKQAGFTKKTAKIEDFENNNTISAMANMVDKIRANNPDTFSREMANNFISVRRSANSDALVTALARAKPGAETKDVLRAAAGDISVLTRLAERDAVAAAAVASSQQRLSMIGSAAPLNPTAAATYMRTLETHRRIVQSAEKQSNLFSDVKRAQDSLDSLNYNRLTSPVGYQYRSWVDHLPRFRGDNANTLAQGGRLARVVRHSFYTTPVRIFQLPFRAGRAWHDIAPVRYIDLGQADSWRRVDAVLRNVRSMDRSSRDALVSGYIRAAPSQRAMQLERIEENVVDSIAGANNVSTDTVRELYRSYSQSRSGTVRSDPGVNRNYSNAMVEDPNAPGTMIRADSFSRSDGTIEHIDPILSTQLQANHVLMDFGLADSIVRNAGSALGRALNGARKVKGGAVEVGDVMSRYWKTSNLLSFRYAIRSVSDDLLGQVARYGAYSMMMRSASGSRNLFGRVSRGTWARSSATADEAAMTLARTEQQVLAEEVAHAERIVLDFPTSANQEYLLRARENLADNEEGLALLTSRNAVRQADRPRIYEMGGRGVVFPAASDGTSGSMFMREVANSRSHEIMLGTTAGRIQRSIPSGNFVDIRMAENPSRHFDAWNRVVSRQLANDPLVQNILRGMTPEDAAQWLRNPGAGRDHWNALRSGYGARNMSRQDLVTRVAAEIEDAIPMGLPGREEIIETALRGEDVTDLLKAVPEGMRPAVIRSEIFDSPVGVNALTRHIDNGIDNFYRYFNELPAATLSRNPLFASLYDTHLADLVQMNIKQGVTHMDKGERLRLADVARRRSLADVKRMSFNMDHEARLAHAFRFAIPFGASFMESANRWFRIIGDKPQVLAHAANLYNSPTRAGWTVDLEGNRIGADGYITDKATGQKRLVPLSERNMVIQIPDWAQPMMEDLFGTALPELPVPMTSIIPTVQGENIWNPGFGPFLQIPLAKAAKMADASPSTEDAFRTLGLLPFQNRSAMAGASWIGEAYKAATGKDYPFGGAEFNQDVSAVVRKMQYDYDSGKRETPPSVEEAKDYARKMSGLKMLQKLFLPIGGNFTRGVEVRQEDGKYIPFGTRDAEGNLTELESSTADINYKPISFFVDRYAEMVQQDPKNGMDMFLDKFGDSFFAFTVSMTKANSTVPSTTGSLKAMEKYEELLGAVDPDLGGLITGPEGKGPFSPGAFYYQLETETMSGDKMRERLSPKEMIHEMDRRRGWYDYNKAMLQLQADLFDSGFQSYQDKGAEYFAQVKGNITDLLTRPRNLDGTPNKNYNRAWEEDYNSQDRGFYDRRASDMQKVVDYFDVMDAVESQDGNGNTTVHRADIYGLRQYLANRRQVQRVLFQRNETGGSDDINAKVNADVKNAFILATIDVMEKYIPFSELHNRYLARDMGIDVFTMADNVAQSGGA